MQTENGTTTIESGFEALQKLLDSLKSEKLNWNEAETRFQFIDPFIVGCLGWPKSGVRVERQEGAQYTDYEMGNPRTIILEAKREGAYFELPANPSKNLIQSMKSLMKLNVPVSEALKQTQSYCAKRGTPIGVVCNGHQLIAFLASRQDGEAPLEGKCLVINGYDHLLKEFPIVWQSLSPDGIKERHLLKLLTKGGVSGLPKKLSNYLTKYPAHRYRSKIQGDLRNVAELLIEDVLKTPEVEAQFYKNCYCESGALAQDALVSRNILESRYSMLLDQKESPVQVTPVKASKKDFALTSEVVTESLSKRPIVLIGDVGVGKTSFVKHLMYVSAFEEFQRSAYVYIDLGSQSALDSDLKKFIILEIERQLLERYEIDVFENSFVRGVYDLDIKRFRNGIYGGLEQSDKAEYERQLRKFLEERIENQPEHLQKSIHHIVRGRRKQVVIVIDNADQRSLNVQQEAFVIAQNFSQNWSCLVFIAFRPQAFHESKQAGALSAYPPKIFSIAPPRVDIVIDKRLKFALEMAEGRLPIEKLQGIQLDFNSMGFFLKALLNSLVKNSDLVEFLSNITGGNIREVIDLVIKFIGSPNVNAEKIISIMKQQGGDYLVPVHEFSKAALLGEYSHYDSKSSIAMNVFDVRYSDEREHFLVSMIIGYLNYDASGRNREGFVSTFNIMSEMQNLGFSPDQIESALKRTTNKRLIETPERLTFAEDTTGLYGDLPVAFRITTVGVYHLNRWCTQFNYLEAMVFDTPIFDNAVIDKISVSPGSFDIKDRLNRAVYFKSYLTTVWQKAELRVPYYDWESQLPAGEDSFKKVQLFISRMSADDWDKG